MPITDDQCMTLLSKDDREHLRWLAKHHRKKMYYVLHDLITREMRAMALSLADDVEERRAANKTT